MGTDSREAGGQEEPWGEQGSHSPAHPLRLPFRSRPRIHTTGSGAGCASAPPRFPGLGTTGRAVEPGLQTVQVRVGPSWALQGGPVPPPRVPEATS